MTHTSLVFNVGNYRHGRVLLHTRIYVADDPSKTLSDLTELETLASIRLLFEFLIVLSQALASVWFTNSGRDRGLGRYDHDSCNIGCVSDDCLIEFFRTAIY